MTNIIGIITGLEVHFHTVWIYILLNEFSVGCILGNYSFFFLFFFFPHISSLPFIVFFLNTEHSVNQFKVAMSGCLSFQKFSQFSWCQSDSSFTSLLLSIGESLKSTTDRTAVEMSKNKNMLKARTHDPEVIYLARPADFL